MDLAVVSVRALRAERGARPIGSPVAVGGAVHHLIAPQPNATMAPGGGCLEFGKWLSLTSDDADSCLGIMLIPAHTSSHLVCRGDITDSCCRANPALPPLNARAVAVGHYQGVRRDLDAAEIDVVEIDEFCLPAPAPKAPPTP